MAAHPHVDAAVDDAIRRVLAAEALAEDDVRAALCRAEAMREAARADARAIAARAERRIGVMRHRFEVLTRGEVARLDAQCVEAAGSAPVGLEPALVARAAQAVAAELTDGVA